MMHDQRIDAGVNIDGAMEHTGSGTTYSPGLVVQQGLNRPFLLLGGYAGTAELSHVDTTVSRSLADFWPSQHGWKRDLHLDNGRTPQVPSYGRTGLQVSPNVIP